MGKKIETVVDELAALPADLAAAVRAERAARARHSEVEAGLAAAKLAMRSAVNNPAVAAGRVLPVAVDVGAWARLRDALGPVPVVERERFDAVVQARVSRWPSVVELGAGMPPRFALEAQHSPWCDVVGRGEAQPFGRDVEAANAFEAACRRFVGLDAQRRELMEPLRGADPVVALVARLKVIEEFERTTLAAWQREVLELRELVDAADRARIESGRAHRCPLIAEPIHAGHPYAVKLVTAPRSNNLTAGRTSQVTAPFGAR